MKKHKFNFIIVLVVLITILQFLLMTLVFNLKQ
jgi:hypothetical protein